MKNQLIKKGFKNWLVQFGLFWFITVYGLIKVYGVIENGFAQEFQLTLLIKEITVWIIATIVASWLIWKFIVLPKKD